MSLPVQHLSDEAVAAFADDMLGGLARGRATRHLAECDECRDAVAVQREAARALRASVDPVVPNSLLQRLRELPMVTPVQPPPGVFQGSGHGTSALGSAGFPVAVPARPAQPSTPPKAERRFGRHHLGLMTATAAMLAMGAVAAGTTTLGKWPGHARTRHRGARGGRTGTPRSGRAQRVGRDRHAPDSSVDALRRAGSGGAAD